MEGEAGKTTVAADLALSLDSHMGFLECGVKELNVHIFAKPRFGINETVSAAFPEVDETRCIPKV